MRFFSSLFDGQILFSIPKSSCGMLNFIKYNWKPIDITKLPLYTNMTATDEGKKLLESL